VREPYFPLFNSVVRSSLWSLSGDCLKVFLTICAEADPEGCCSASIDGIRRIADLPIEDVVQHLKTLEGPDPHSKDLQRAPANGGRRLERIAGGWRVTNLEWYREEARKQSELARKRRWWNDKGSDARRDARRTETNTHTQTDTNTYTETDPDPSGSTNSKTADACLLGRVPREPAPPEAPPPPSSETRKRGSAGGRPRSVKRILPDDFAPTAEHVTIARESGANLELEFAKMRDWAAENAVRKADWNATFRNWLRRAGPSRAAAGWGRGASAKDDAMNYLLSLSKGESNGS